jgi:ammonia channel protein AmtB
VFIAATLSLSMTYLTMLIIDKIVGVNISIEAEHHGLDKVELGKNLKKIILIKIYDKYM